MTTELCHFPPTGDASRPISLGLLALLLCGVAATAQPWMRAHAPLPSGNWNCVAVSTNANIVVVAIGGGTLSGPVCLSTNSGKDWNLTSAPVTVWAAVASSADSSQLVAAEGGTFLSGHIYLSTNWGATWTPTSAPFTNWFSLASSADGTKLVAAAGGNCSSGPIYVSADSGATWTMTSAPVTNWISVVSSSDGSNLAAGSVFSGIYLSRDAGGTWRSTQPGSGWWWSLASSENGRKLVAAAPAGPVYISSDSGATWSLTGVPSPYGGGTSVASSADGTHLVATVSVGSRYLDAIYTSTDSGMTWRTNDVSGYYSTGGGWRAVASSADGSKLVAVVCVGDIYTWQLAPILSMRLTNDSTTISWPAVSAAAGCLLEQACDLSMTNWTDILTPTTFVTNGQCQVILPRSADRQFYRLKRM